MPRKFPLLPFLASLALPAAASAQDNSAQYFSTRQPAAAVPVVLAADERSRAREAFAALRANDWARVESLLAQGVGVLDPVVRAELYLHPESPRVGLDQIANWMPQGRRLPYAERLNALAVSRGSQEGFILPRERRLEPRGYAPKRILPRGTGDGTISSEMSNAILDRIKNDDPDGARLLLDGIDATLSTDARAEWRQRVAWSYYIENMDAQALAMAQSVYDGTGPWVAEGAWVGGLAAWRLGDCLTAGSNFEESARRASNPELQAAAYYWASRATIRCRRPGRAAELLRGAAVLDNTLYGMLALEQLGQAQPDRFGRTDFNGEDWREIGGLPEVQMAIALSEIGEEDIAGEVLRHLSGVVDGDNFNAISRLARGLGLPGTQLWLAHRAPRGADPEPAAQFPVARWQPVGGWRVDPALAYAHALQESNFQRGVVSGAGATGLMQIMPIAAREYGPSLGMNNPDLRDASVNLAFGQRALEVLSESRGTQGKLPKIMAAYNAGLTPVTRWEGEVRDQGDALLYMESIPYWETRGYVAIVTRNYWMYERQANAPSPSRRALSENKWPMFPRVQR
ncbi:transglycosylase SLT domain-containing protein [Alteriqipengyuania flavescens]|uniref:transglycosylase SLT domain-containing protein n=1 Tax=Alteriqipengyuania flavescens TaxID=3053610 RepID=UPI0025B37768|nr:transglycosylase SLT domain-containing protein [Alteriqipengyuania flavescens]WJY18482.1 transglycosylase SLT domain-containing protein [Alteriqipengyuania flavescens]WJY24423.1 transglycosylase SLT domain-containing protein [Alteriqipengyuania flavescens]